jgi:hypothetical protein
MVASTMLVFFVTWFFHSYQWFWSLGTWLWSATDTLFWSLLGVCLIANSLLESRRGRVRSVGVPRPTVARLLGHSAQTAAMFSLMCVLWALWTSPTMRAFGDLVGGAQFGARDVAVLFAVWITVGVLAAFTYRRAHSAAGKSTLPRWAAASTAALLSLVSLSEVAPVQKRLSPSTRSVLAKARDLDLNKRDQEQMQRGYYEKIVGVNRFNNELWKVYSLRPRDWVRLDSTGAVRLTNDDRLEELVPGFSANFHGGRLTINSAGLRDREYAVEKPANVFRIAVLGQSYVLGEGVNDDQTFENVLENRLNESDAAALGYSRIEILNFGAPAYSALQQRADLVVGRVAKWRPDVVLCVGHFRELAQIDDYFRSFLRQRGGGNLPPEVARWIDAAGLTKEMSATEAERRLAPFAVQILSDTYLDMTRRIRSMGARPLFAYIPTPAVPIEAQKLTDYLATASGAGFDTMLDLRNVYGGGNEMRFVLQPWDHHPNVDGHRRIAEVLYRELQGHAGLLRRDGEESGKR